MNITDSVPFDDICIGMFASYTKTITDSDIKIFAGLSGDYNPVHVDEVYAENSRFKKRIAHGMISSSFFSALFGTKLPGYGCVYTSQNLQFRHPVYIDDTVTAKVTVKNINKESRRIIFDTVCTVGKKRVITGEAEIYVPK